MDGSNQVGSHDAKGKVAKDFKPCSGQRDTRSCPHYART